MSLMTNEQLDEMAKHLPFIEAWVKAVKAEIESALRAGGEFTNASLERKIGNRTWKDGVDPLALLRKFSRLDVVAPRVPLSPTQAEKILGKDVYIDKLAQHIHRPVTGTKLVLTQED